MTEKKVKKKSKKLSSSVTPSSVDSPESIDVSSILKNLQSEITKDIVSNLKPEMEKGIESRFEQIKQIVINEMKDLRQGLGKAETEQQQQNQNPQATPNIENLVQQAQQAQPQQNQSSGMDKFGMIAQLLPLLQQSGIIGNNQGGQMGGMLQEAMMRKFLADISRSDYQNQAMTNYLFKQVFKENPMEMNKTDDALMSPIKKYGDIMEKKKQQESEKNE